MSDADDFATLLHDYMAATNRDAESATKMLTLLSTYWGWPLLELPRHVRPLVIASLMPLHAVLLFLHDYLLIASTDAGRALLISAGKGLEQLDPYGTPLPTNEPRH